MKVLGQRGRWALFSFPAAVLLWAGGIMFLLARACLVFGDCV